MGRIRLCLRPQYVPLAIDVEISRNAEKILDNLIKTVYNTLMIAQIVITRHAGGYKVTLMERDRTVGVIECRYWYQLGMLIETQALNLEELPSFTEKKDVDKA